jgi:hypothetical protein
MITTVDNSQKVFMLCGDMNRSVFCNLHDIPTAARTFDELSGIYYFWNNKPKRIGKRQLNEWFAANQINDRVK